MLDHVWIIPAIPAVSFIVILLFGKRMPFKGAEVGTAAVGASFLLACVVAAQWIDKVESVTGHSEGLAALGHGVLGGAENGGHGREAEVTPIVHGVTWWQNGAVKFAVGTRTDGLVVMMLIVVTTISLLVHIYSLAYMRGDRRFTYFYAALSLFSAAVLAVRYKSNRISGCS